MKKLLPALALAGVLLCPFARALSLDDVQLWTGSGTNRAALVIEWNPPEIYNNTTVPAPVANKTMVWGYRFNGSATDTQMFNAIVAADPRLYAVEYIDPMYGTGVQGIGYNLDGRGIAGLTDGTTTNPPATFTNGLLINSSLNLDAAHSLDRGDLYWGGFGGPYWQLWTELGDAGGFLNSPNRGTNQYWDPVAYTQGEWASAYYGLDYLALTNGSWLGFSISACGYDGNTNDSAYYVFNNDEQAPPSPDGTYTAFVPNTNDFAVQIISTNNLISYSPYNDPTAILGQPTLRFYDPYDGAVTDRVSLIDPPFNVTPTGSPVITEITSGGQITVKMGRKVYDDPNNPYGTDLMIYGNSFYSPVGGTGPVSDRTDLNAVTLSSKYSGHGAMVSVSQDGTNWFTFTNQAAVFPAEAYRWDDVNDAWTDEAMNPDKPLNPYLYTNNFAGQTVAAGVDQMVGAAGGSGFNLSASGLPWIQFVRVQPLPGTYAVIDAVAAVDPAVVGDALSLCPDNLAGGCNRLAFQDPANPAQTRISLNFVSLDAVAKISTVSLADLSSFAPVKGSLAAAYQLQARPLTGSSPPNYSAQVGLRVAANYVGNGSDLRVFQWGGTNWQAPAFTYDAAANQVVLAGVTNFSAFAITQIIPPAMNLQPLTNGFACRITPVPNCLETLERSTNLVSWCALTNFTATNAQPITLLDTNAPPGQAFYRVYVNP